MSSVGMAEVIYIVLGVIVAVPSAYIISLAAATAYFEAKLKYQKQFLRQIEDTNYSKQQEVS